MPDKQSSLIVEDDLDWAEMLTACSWVQGLRVSARDGLGRCLPGRALGDTA